MKRSTIIKNRAMNLKRIVRTALLFVFLFNTGTMHAASEKIMVSRAGSSPLTAIVASTSTITVADQWYSYMLANPVSGGTPWTDVFTVPDASNGLPDAFVNVVLRFDDKKRTFFTAGWTIKVNYTIKTYDAAGTASSPLSHSLTITYNPTGTYKDKAVMRYPEAFKADITITAVYLNNVLQTAPLGASYSDVYLDFEQETNRTYIGTTAPSIDHNRVVLNTENELEVAWNYIQGAESYDLEWLFIDEPTISSLSASTLEYNFKNATRVNLPEQHYHIPMAFPRGIVLYRVRGVSRDPADPGLFITGDWSNPSIPANGQLDTDAPVTSTSKKYRYDYDGLQAGMNWQYSAAFAEDGKRKETISFFDGSLHGRQAQTKLNTDNNLVIGETKYDYQGRAAVQIMPVPVSGHQGFKYYNNFNPNFDRDDFDLDANINNPGALSTSSGAGKYYSPSNGNLSNENAFIPDALGYAYAQTRFKTDGTGRIRSQSSAGPDHKLGSGHETKFYYGAPSSQDELDRLFGNEVGILGHYQKNMVRDANGQVSVNYLDQEGRTIATALAGNVPANLLALDNRPGNQTHTNNLLAGRNNLNQEHTAMVTSYPMLVTADDTEYEFVYSLSSDTSCWQCYICETCQYDLEITILDEDGNLVPDVSITSHTCSLSTAANPIVCTGISSGLYNFSATLEVGSYTVLKTLRLSETSIDQFREDFIQYQLENFSCVAPDPIHPESCDFSCETMCEKLYTTLDENGNTVYIGDDGLVLADQEDGPGLVAACIAANCTTSTALPDECTIKYNLLLTDMSPGGQYFDNKPFEYIEDTDGNFQLNSSYDPDGWLTANVNTTLYPSLWTDFNTYIANTANNCTDPSVTVSSWATVRANWQPCFAGYLAKFHPEYCAYSYNCIEFYCEKIGDTIAAETSIDYDEDMYAVSDDATANTNGYLNPASITVNTSVTNSDPANGNNTYVNNTAGLDPWLSCENAISDCGSNTTLQRMQDFLLNFLPVPASTPQAYYSIWYVLEDPHGIAPNGTSTGAATEIVDYFRALHGYGTTPGLIGTGSGQMTKYEYFRSVYMYFKKLIQYAHYPEATVGCSTPLLTDVNNDGFTEETGPGSSIIRGYQIRYPKNPMFEIYRTSPPSPILLCQIDPAALQDAMEDLSDNTLAEQCSATCEASADGWIYQLESCSLSTTTLADIRYYLIEICKANCDYTNTSGTSGCPTCTGVQLIGNPSIVFHDFDDVIAHFASTCSVTVEHPEVYDGAACSCGNLESIISNNTLSTNAEIRDYFNNTVMNGTGTFTTTDVAGWLSECANTTPSNATLATLNLPAPVLCPNTQDVTLVYNAGSCACENIHAVINAMGLDPDNTADHAAITAGLNAYLNPTTAITTTNWQDWLTECEQTSPSLTVLNADNLPAVLACPVPASSEEADIIAATELAGCQQSNLAEAMGNAVQLFMQKLETAADAYITYTRNNCLDNLSGRETFQETHVENEFLYTLYYYDQAGNLVKTVPPEGVVQLTPTQIDDVQDYRAGVPGSSFTVPAHLMVTRYAYNSLQQLIEQETPDGGLAHFWYDALGRQAVSQNARQANGSNYSASTPAFSYALYDNLGRNYESGQLFNTTAMTSVISRDKDPATTSPTNDLAAWLGAGTKNEVVRSYFDEAMGTSVPGFTAQVQQFLRNRISSVLYFLDAPNGTYSNYNSGTHYSYDIHGNATKLVKENTDLTAAGLSIKTMAYDYDLLTGNINEAHYQEGYYDQFHQRYWYDADNRLTVAWSSRDRVIWEKEVKNIYYNNGNLARYETGDRVVQGTDYFNTIHGWLKSINSTTMQADRDAGKDGQSSATNRHRFFARDAAAYTLGYFTGDYKAIDVPQNSGTGAALAAEASSPANAYQNAIYELYNGNISRMTTALLDINEAPQAVLGNVYRFDQNSRIRLATRYTDANLVSSNGWTTTATSGSNQYGEEFHFDFNGNITSLKRYGNGGTAMDDMTYRYDMTTTVKKNRLLGVNDAVNAGNYETDIDDQGTITVSTPATWNYDYDEIGNLVLDKKEYITKIDWTVNGKIRFIEKDKTYKVRDVNRNGIVDPEDDMDNNGIADEVVLQDLEFVYDAAGNRIEKIVKPHKTQAQGLGLTNQLSWIHTYYERDGSGKVMAVYQRTFKDLGGSNYSDNYDLQEQHIYGGNRVGVRNDVQVLEVVNFTATGFTSGTLRFTGISYTSQPASPPATNVAVLYERYLGYKAYELSNHLQNVLVTLNDRKLAVQDPSNTTLSLYYMPDVISTSDYYAFGGALPGRTGSANTYRYGFNGKENDPETGTQDYGLRIYNPSLGKFLSVDPLAPEYPWNSTYAFAENDVIESIDLDGAESMDFRTHMSIFGTSPAGPVYGMFTYYYDMFLTGMYMAGQGTVQRIKTQTNTMPYSGYIPEGSLTKSILDNTNETVGKLKQVNGIIDAYQGIEGMGNTLLLPLMGIEGGLKIGLSWGTRACVTRIGFHNPDVFKAKYEWGGKLPRSTSVRGLTAHQHGLYSITYKHQRSSGFVAEVGSAKLSKEGVLTLDFAVPRKVRGKGILSASIEDAAKTFGYPQVDACWVYNNKGIASTNLKSFLENYIYYGGSYNALDAAKITPTGRSLSKLGYEPHDILWLDPEEVGVSFIKKPNQ